MMDVNAFVSTSASKSSMNDTEEKIDPLTLHVPSYLYREIPTLFETIGIMLNIAIIVYFIKSGKYRTPTFAILTSLAAMDTCVCLGGVITIFLVPRMVSAEGGFLCPLAYFLVVTGALGSEYTLIFFTGVKLYQVIAPLKARAAISMSLIVKYCATLNVVSACLSLVHAAFCRPVTIVTNGEYIMVCGFIGDGYYRDFTILIVLTVIPCFTILLLHVLKYFAHARLKRLLTTKQERKSPDAHVVAIMVSLFYVCWIPALAYATVQHFKTDDFAPMQDNLYLVLAHVIYVNSILNPLVYVLAMKSIRDDVIKLFCFARY